VKTLLPDSYGTLSFLVEALPNGDWSPVHPFSGFVLNMNVCTRIHRDWGDEDICLVLVLSDCSGGELCLKEPGVVLKLATGDVVLFKSSEISHFNLHYNGKRASLVFHTDRAARSWAKDRNGWQHNVYMLSTLSSDPNSDL
jgi:predicted 2-oxoglutarate/Fe(II)-dependent dioxygenase YbiX